MMMTQKKREGGHYSTNNYWASSFALKQGAVWADAAANARQKTL